jgi:hypothetical protein
MSYLYLVVKYLCARCGTTKETAGACCVCGSPTQRIDI